MEQKTIASLQKDERFLGFLLVRSAEQRQSSKGQGYLDMTLCDKTGDLNAKMWDGTKQPPEQGSIIKVQATVQEYNGRLQLRVERIWALEEKDNVDPTQLMPCAPLPPDQMLTQIYQEIDGMKTPDLQNILREMLRMCGDKLSYFPAAQRLHHAERSGLLHHTTDMLRAANAILTVYDFLDADLLKAGVIAHDLSKIDEYYSDKSGNVSDYSKDGLLLGHLVRGVTRVDQAAQKAGVDSEYVVLLEHMVISHHNLPEFGSPRAPMFPEAEALHMLDDLDAKMNEMAGILRRTPRGAFSEKIWSLDRRVYHPEYLSEETPAPSQQTPPEDSSVPDDKENSSFLADGLLPY